MKTHHPDLSLLTAYASGQLPDAQALAIATHVSLCPLCRSRQSQLQAMAGSMLDALPAAPVSADLLSRTLARLDSAAPAPAAAMPAGANVHEGARRNTASTDLPAPLRSLLPDGLPKRWTWIAPGLKQATLARRPDGSIVALHHIRAGARVPAHTHEGDEITVVLRGSFSDEQGLYRHGDFILADEQLEHMPTAARNEDCLCLTVQSAPLVLTGLFGRLLNPLLRTLR